METGGSATPRLLLSRTATLVDPNRPLAESGIISGDELVLDPAVLPEPPAPSPIHAVSIDLIEGPDSGHSAPLDRGAYTYGRGEGCDLIVGDPTVSRFHMRIEVAADWSVTITPQPDTHNGVQVNGATVSEPTQVGNDDVVTTGATSVAFREYTRAPDTGVDRLGQVEFHRTPYRPPQVAERTLESLGQIPTAPEPRRFQALAAIAPLAAGLSMFAFTRQPQFLALTALSPLVLVANYFEDRKSGRKRHEIAVEKFRESIDQRRAEVAEALSEERMERVRAAPDLADLARRAELRTVDLWARDRHAPDFLRLRLGLGDAPSKVTVPTERGGDEDLREELERAVEGHDHLSGVPVTVPFAEAGVVGVHGEAAQVDSVAASMLLQAACLHSPEDLIITAAAGESRAFMDWLKWLPQTRSATSPLAGPHIAATPEGTRAILAGLVEVAQRRTAAGDRGGDPRWPWLFVVLDGDLEPDPALVSQLLDHSPEAGISVLWVCDREARVPRQANAVVDCGSSGTLPGGSPVPARLWHTDPDSPAETVVPGRVHPAVADRVARSLAPVRDASVASATTAIPRSAPLLTVLGEERPDAAWVMSRWLTERPYGLEHPVGLAADGIFSLDLVADGPHALIGGTSGAGKSELLQSMVASLVSLYPPTRLNFLFVDYKGGASSTVFRDVPHTVGYVTNLNADLALRALTSLRAELNRRMAVMEGRAKDLRDMLAKHPEEAPASLVIVVDEFATLVKEIPDFVAGIVDIAQRGRSLGIHLVLATQRPSGSVNDNILANTNLRVSLRMLDRAESNAVINSGEAAEIPVPLHGRGYARLGPAELVAFQSAYASAPLVEGDDEAPVTVEDFVADPFLTGARRSTPDAAVSGDHAEAPTQLDALIAAIVEASGKAHFPPPSSPWRDVLPEHVTVESLLADPRAAIGEDMGARVIPVGLVDDPEHQDQYPAMVDLEEGGGLLIYGSGGSGRTSLLRSMAATAALSTSPQDLVIFGLDFSSRSLRSIEPLPHVSEVGTGDDLESATRTIALLAGEISRRTSALAELQAENLSAYRELGGRLPRVLVLVDGYPNMASAFSGGSGIGASLDQWIETFNRVVIDGRQVGIHCVLTADRRNSVNALVQSAVANRVVLRQAEEAGYADHGVPLARARNMDLPPGRGLWKGELTVQFSCVSDTPEAAAQAGELAELSLRLRESHPEAAAAAPAIRTAPLPERVELDPVQAAPPGLAVVLGLVDLTLESATINLDHSNFLICGLPRSGRSTAAALVATGLAAGGAEVWTVGGSSSPLRGAEGVAHSAFGKADSVAPTIDELCTVADALPGEKPRVLVVDDLDDLDDMSLTPLWERLMKSESVRVVATVETRNIGGFSTNPMLNEIRKARRALYLQPDDPTEFFQTTGVKAPIRPGTPIPPGRGVLVVDRQPVIIQVAAGYRDATNSGAETS